MSVQCREGIAAFIGRHDRAMQMSARNNNAFAAPQMYAHEWRCDHGDLARFDVEKLGHIMRMRDRQLALALDEGMRVRVDRRHGRLRRSQRGEPFVPGQVSEEILAGNVLKEPEFFETSHARCLAGSRRRIPVRGGHDQSLERHTPMVNVDIRVFIEIQGIEFVAECEPDRARLGLRRIREARFRIVKSAPK